MEKLGLEVSSPMKSSKATQTLTSLNVQDLDMNTEVLRSFWDTPAPKGSNTGTNGVSTRPSEPFMTPKVRCSRDL